MTAVDPVSWARIDISTLPAASYVKETASLEFSLLLFSGKLREK
jgi:hypothetical protein